jgi:uncharacterized repeat protein (TIGR03806 family)
MEWTRLVRWLVIAGVLAGCNRSTAPDAQPPVSMPPPTNANCVAPPRPSASVTLSQAFSSLPAFSSPLLMQQAPADARRWYVVEKGGRLYWFDNNSAVTTRNLFIDLTNVVDARSEGGLLGMAFHPAFASNGYIYLSYTTSDNPVNDNGANFRSRISRFTVSSDRNTLLPASELNLLTFAQPFDNHNGGHIAFGADGLLYIGFGDGGSGGDPQNNGQRLDTWLGKFLRIDVDNGTPYAIPPTNPFAGGGGLPEIYAWGFRNPWRWSFDRDSGELWAGDVGQGSWEEVDKVTLGGNYGWRYREGAHCYSPSSNCPTAGLIDPVVEYGHSNGRCSITGGYVYRGNNVPALRGHYVFGDFCTGEVWGLPQGSNSAQPLASSGLAISSFGEGNDGEVYVIGYGNGRLYRIAPGSGAPGGIAQRLTDTGCVNPANATQPAAGLIAYDINAPFWSDGASKDRFMALPSGTRMHIESNHDWTFPVGTILMKHFALGGRLIETRLFMRHPDGEWGGYSYEWDVAQTDALLVPNGKSVTIGGQSWRYPSGGECLRCHTAASGRALGPETGQMNRSFAHPVTGVQANQLSTYEQLGLFDAPLAGPPASLPAFPSPSNTGAPLEQRARSYLHANCSHCHRPNGPTPVAMDLRYDTALAATATCNVVPQEGNLGVSGARLILPGDPARSVVALRMRALDTNRMPPLASSVVDADGAALIESWIVALTSCP